MKKSIVNMGATIGTLFLIWLLISYLEIVCKCLASPVYSEYNAFVILLQICDGILK